MKEMEEEIGRVLREPQLVRRSRSDTAGQLFYEFYAQTNCGWQMAVLWSRLT